MYLKFYDTNKPLIFIYEINQLNYAKGSILLHENRLISLYKNTVENEEYFENLKIN